MDHQTEQALQHLLAGNASGEELELLKQALSSGQVAIGGNVQQSVIILGNGNTVQLTPQALEALNGRSLLGDLERDLTPAEIDFGLTRLAELLPERAPTLKDELETLTRRLRSTLKTDPRALGSEARAERTETLARLNSLCMEATEIAFNALCTGIEPPAYDSSSPFRGLESFRPEDAAYFFGREALTRKLVQKLNEHNFLAVLGASGSGKSSLVMAGLIPALSVPYTVFRPGAEPLAELEKALLPSPAGRGAGGEGGPQLLVVDQFEELFTLSAREQRSEFISRLREQSQRLRVVITLRADFLGEVAPFKSLKDEVQNHQEIIPPMDEAELRRAMEGQAGCAGLRFESDLSQQMLDDVSGEPGAMPLLQHALWTLWMRRHGRWLRAEEYRAFGGVKQAIASTAEAVYARCTDFEKERLRDIFLRLTRLDDSADGRDTRRRVLLRDLIPAESTRGKPADSEPAATTLLIKQLADARLVVISGGLETTAQTEVEVAHEALIRHWERLRAWLNDDRDNLRLREGVSDDARRWENAARDESLLNHRGPRLELALAMSKNPRYRLNPVEQAYLDGCMGLREKESKAKETLRRRIITGLATGLVIAIALLAFSFWAYNQSEARRVVALGQVEFAKGDSLRAIILALQATQIASVPEAQNLLQDATDNLDYLPQYFQGHKGMVTTVAWSMDGHLASGSDDGTIIIWDLKNERPLQFPKGESVNCVAWSEDERLASGSADGTVTLWDIENNRPIQILKSDAGKVISVAWSVDGRLASGLNNGKVIIWDLKNGQAAQILHTTFPRRVNSLTWSVDGLLAAGLDDGTVIIWDSENGHMIQILSGHSSYVTSVAWSTDGLLASGSWDGSVIIWDLKTGQPAQILRDQLSNVSSVAWSSKGQLASGAWDGSVIIWDLKTGQPAQTLKDQSSFVSSIAWSTDGQLASGFWDGSITIWNINNSLSAQTPTYNYFSVYSASLLGNKRIASGLGDGGEGGETPVLVQDIDNDQIIHELGGHLNDVRSVAWSVDERLASGSWDGQVIIWDLENNQPAQILKANSGPIDSVDWSLDGRLASGSEDGQITIWDLNVGQPAQILKNVSAVWNVAWSKDGKLAAGLEDGTIIIWDIKNGQPPKILEAHSSSIGSVAWSVDERLASGSRDGTVTIWNLETGQRTQILKEHSDWVSTLAWSTEGRLASGANDGKVIIWDLENGRSERTLNNNSSISSVSWLSDGRLFYGTMQGYVKIVDERLTHSYCNVGVKNLSVFDWTYTIGTFYPYQPACPNLRVDAIPLPSLDKNITKSLFWKLTWPGRILALITLLLIFGLLIILTHQVILGGHNLAKRIANWRIKQ